VTADVTSVDTLERFAEWDAVTMDTFTSYEPTPVDFYGQLQLDLLASAKAGRNGKEELQLWRNRDGRFET
jgi:hypothetical protein